MRTCIIDWMNITIQTIKSNSKIDRRSLTRTLMRTLNVLIFGKNPEKMHTGLYLDNVLSYKTSRVKVVRLITLPYVHITFNPERNKNKETTTATSNSTYIRQIKRRR